MKSVIIFVVLAIANAAPNPEPCYNCQSRRLFSPKIQAAYTPPIAHRAPVYTTPIVHERVYTAPATSVVPPPFVTSHHAHVNTGTALPAPTIVKDYVTHSVGPAEYYPVSTEVHTTSQNRYQVQVPVTYTYTLEQPVKHSTTVYRQSGPLISNGNPYGKVYSAPVEPGASWSSGYIPPEVSSVHSSSWSPTHSDRWY